MMKDKYFNKITRLLESVQPKIISMNQLKFKNVFGAVGGYVNDCIFMSCGKFGVALRPPPETLDELLEKERRKTFKISS